MTPDNTRSLVADALYPFADAAEEYEPQDTSELPVGDEQAVWPTFTVGDLRRARKALAALSPSPTFTAGTFNVSTEDFGDLQAAKFVWNGKYLTRLDVGGDMSQSAWAKPVPSPQQEGVRVQVAQAIQIIELCARAAEAQDRIGREWVSNSLWANILARAGQNVRAISPDAILALLTPSEPTPMQSVMDRSGLDNHLTPAHPDAYLNALLDYTAGFYNAAVKAGLGAGPAADAMQHVERAARGLHALAHPSDQGDGWRLPYGVTDAMLSAGMDEAQAFGYRLSATCVCKIFTAMIAAVPPANREGA